MTLAESASSLTPNAVRKMREAMPTGLPPHLEGWPGEKRLVRRWHYRLPAANVWFEKHHLFVGVYWRVESHHYSIQRIPIYEQWLHIYVGIVPLFPIHLTIKRWRVWPGWREQGDNEG